MRYDFYCRNSLIVYTMHISNHQIHTLILSSYSTINTYANVDYALENKRNKQTHTHLTHTHTVSYVSIAYTRRRVPIFAENNFMIVCDYVSIQ